jgi:hypothetical protein
MLLLMPTTDKIQLISAQAATLDVHSSFVDYASGTITPGRTNAAITTATTTDIVAAPGASTQRNAKTINVRNKHATLSCDVTVQHTDGTTVVELVKMTLSPGDTLEYIEGVGWFKVLNPANNAAVNYSTADQTGFAADTYLGGSAITLPSGLPRVGTTYKLRFDMSKTAAGAAAPSLIIRVGTTGTTTDTGRLTLALSVGTAATDVGVFDVLVTFRTVGSGVNAVIAGILQLASQPTTGLSSLLKGAHAVSAGFDSTTAGLIIGASFNGGTSFAGTCNLVRAELAG